MAAVDQKLGKSLDAIIEENKQKVVSKGRKSSEGSRPRGMRIDGGSKGVRLAARKAPGSQGPPPRRGGAGVNTGLGVKAAGIRKKSNRPSYSYDAMDEDDDYGMGGGYGGGGGRAGRRGGRGGYGGNVGNGADEYGMGGGGPRRRIRDAPVPRGNPDAQWRHDLFDDTDRRPPRRVPGAALAGRLGTGAAAANSSTLLVSNLHYEVSNQDIQDLFKECDGFVRGALHFDDSGRSEEKATVVFATRADAQKAIKQYNGVLLDKKEMRLEFAEPEVEEPRGGARSGIMGRLGGRGERVSTGAGTGMGFQRAMRDAVPRAAGGSRIPGRMGGSGPARRGRLTSGVVRNHRTKEELDAEMDTHMQE